MPKRRTSSAEKELLGEGLAILQDLESRGFTTFLVGGAVRDLLLHRPLHDLDMVTSAPREVLKNLYPRGRLLGKPASPVYLVPLPSGTVVGVQLSGLLSGERPCPAGLHHQQPGHGWRRRDVRLSPGPGRSSKTSATLERISPRPVTPGSAPELAALPPWGFPERFSYPPGGTSGLHPLCPGLRKASGRTGGGGDVPRIERTEPCLSGASAKSGTSCPPLGDTPFPQTRERIPSLLPKLPARVLLFLLHRGFFSGSFSSLRRGRSPGDAREKFLSSATMVLAREKSPLDGGTSASLWQYSRGNILFRGHGSSETLWLFLAGRLFGTSLSGTPKSSPWRGASEEMSPLEGPAPEGLSKRAVSLGRNLHGNPRKTPGPLVGKASSSAARQNSRNPEDLPGGTPPMVAGRGKILLKNILPSGKILRENCV